MDNAFLDTNIIIANIFEINSNHIKSKKVFNDYSKFFWSLNVKNELKRRFPIKKQNLLKFFLDLSIELNNPKQEFFTVLDLNRFANGSFSEKQKNDVESSLMPFWNHYIGIESIVSVQNILNGINNCLFDLNVFLAVNKKNLEKLLILTPKRTKKIL